jgi:hypothetical protein
VGQVVFRKEACSFPNDVVQSFFDLFFKKYVTFDTNKEKSKAYSVDIKENEIVKKTDRIRNINCQASSAYSC